MRILSINLLCESACMCVCVHFVAIDGELKIINIFLIYSATHASAVLRTAHSGANLNVRDVIYFRLIPLASCAFKISENHSLEAEEMRVREGERSIER